jgi:hypothetical protein
VRVPLRERKVREIYRRPQTYTSEDSCGTDSPVEQTIFSDRVRFDGRLR